MQHLILLPCPGGGDGLFALRDVPPDTFISFYHGVVYGPGQTGDNPNTGTGPLTMIPHIKFSFRNRKINLILTTSNENQLIIALKVNKYTVNND